MRGGGREGGREGEYACTCIIYRDIYMNDGIGGGRGGGGGGKENMHVFIGTYI